MGVGIWGPNCGQRLHARRQPGARGPRLNLHDNRDAESPPPHVPWTWLTGATGADSRTPIIADGRLPLTPTPSPFSCQVESATLPYPAVWQSHGIVTTPGNCQKRFPNRSTSTCMTPALRVANIIHVHTYIHTHTHARTHARTHTHIHTYIHTYIHTWTSTPSPYTYEST